MSADDNSGWRAGSHAANDEDEAGVRPTRRRVHPLLIALAVVGSIHLFFLLAIELDRNLVTGRDVARLQGDVRSLNAELAQLREVAGHGDDHAYRELMARKQGFVYPSESLLVTGRE